MDLQYIDSIESLLGKKLGVGSEKECFIKAKDSRRCVKISRKTRSNQIKREIDYFYFLSKRKIKASFVPVFYGAFETPDFIGYEQECIVGKDFGGGFDSVRSLSDYIEDPKTNIEMIGEMLRSLKKEMIDLNIICCDLHGGNVLVTEIQNKVKLVVIDGFGAPEFFPLCKYINILGRIKIKRQWEKFEKRLRICIETRKSRCCLGNVT